MLAVIDISSATKLVYSAKPKLQEKHLHLYPEIVNYLSKTFTDLQVIAEMIYAMLCDARPASVAPILYANDLYSE